MKNKNVILLAFVGATTAVASLLVFVQRKNLRDYSREVGRLFAIARNTPNEPFHYDQLKGLPKPVQRYFRHVLPDGYPHINTVRLKHSGQFKTAPDQKWTNIRGEQYFTVDPPGFIWKGKTVLFTGIDQFVNGQGRLRIRLGGLFKIVDAQRSSTDQGELLRWLGESVWFPTNLLPSEHLHWESVDEYSARLHYTYRSMRLYYIVTFNEQYEIIRLETQRYMEENRLETWVGELANYQQRNQVLIPNEIRATWKLADGDYTYVNFRVEKVKYDQPEQY